MIEGYKKNAKRDLKIAEEWKYASQEADYYIDHPGENFISPKAKKALLKEYYLKNRKKNEKLSEELLNASSEALDY